MVLGEKDQDVYQQVTGLGHGGIATLRNVPVFQRMQVRTDRDVDKQNKGNKVRSTYCDDSPCVKF